MKPLILVLGCVLSIANSCQLVLLAQDSDASSSNESPDAGHSFHGEAFNEGPRQAAYLMKGMGNVRFEATTTSEQTQQFVSQGVAQLHGFWYYEAERSFRQAAVFDPDCAIAYWGMAMANVENRKRAREFIAEAIKRKDGASRREKMLIDAYAKFCQDLDDAGKKIEKKQRAQAYTRALEEIVEEFPEDIDILAFLGLQLWQNERNDLPIVSHVAINSVLQDVFDANPMHPAHHYRIHLWDKQKPKLALESAALCGPSLPGIAHMWHMPGHIYSKLHRYQDACWQQEASARVDHAHMMRDRVMPDQIHNFAHNNEWLIRNLIKVGRVEDALSLAKNMIELPRHPKYNTLSKSGSAKYGRERLLLTLATYRLWPELIAISETSYLPPTDDSKLQVERLRHLGVAFALTGQADQAEATAAELRNRVKSLDEQLESLERARDSSASTTAKEEKSESLVAEVDPSPPLSEEDAKKADENRKRKQREADAERKKLEEEKKVLEKALRTVSAAMHAAAEEWKDAASEAKDAEIDVLLRAEWQAAAGEYEEALKLVEKEIDSKGGEVLPVAVKAWLQFQHAGAEEAHASFEQTRILAALADLETPMLSRLEPLAAAGGFERIWAAPYDLPQDVGARPPLSSLGPFRWQPYFAPEFLVKGVDDQTFSGSELQGKPTVVIFYLGFGCLHCVEQLHEFSPRAQQFRDSGINIVAISTESREQLKKALSTYTKPIDIPLHADEQQLAFKAFRCFDDFESQPLHGTFVIAPDGRVLWQDISYEPFMDVDFVLEESHRLLSLAGFDEMLTPPVPLGKSSAPDL